MSAIVDSMLLPGWKDSVHDAQATFRHLLQALSEPGTVQHLPLEVTGPAPLHAATTTLCLALLDLDTPLWLSDSAPEVQSYLRFHCGCPQTRDPAEAAFAIVFDSAEGLALDSFSQGNAEYPDRSTTVLVQVPTLEQGPRRVIGGPGIPGERALRIGALPDNFDAMWRANGAGFPLGVDLVFCCGNAIVGLPRTTQIHV